MKMVFFFFNEELRYCELIECWRHPGNVFNTFSRFEMNLPAAQGGDSERFLVVVAIVFVPGRGYRGGQV